jgi:hypothetical protein
MTIYSLGTAVTTLLFLVVHFILLSLSAIGLDVPFLVAIMADKISVLLLFSGATFAFAFALDWGNCIEGGRATSPVSFFIDDAGNYFCRVEASGIARH